MAHFCFIRVLDRRRRRWLPPADSVRHCTFSSAGARPRPTARKFLNVALPRVAQVWAPRCSRARAMFVRPGRSLQLVFFCVECGCGGLLESARLAAGALVIVAVFQ